MIVFLHICQITSIAFNVGLSLQKGTFYQWNLLRKLIYMTWHNHFSTKWLFICFWAIQILKQMFWLYPTVASSLYLPPFHYLHFVHESYLINRFFLFDLLIKLEFLTLTPFVYNSWLSRFELKINMNIHIPHIIQFIIIIIKMVVPIIQINKRVRYVL